MSCPDIIKDLVKRFDENKHTYKDISYDEENTKIEFINPFFEALGWDVHNKKGSSAKYKEVVFEDTIKINGKAKAPDYSFRLGGQRIFFVEAKKPSVKIDTDKSPAFQVRRYGWSAGLPLCILTDFEELAIYETVIKPDKRQNASIGRIRYYSYEDYVEKWDEIASIFSKESVLNGSFDNFVTGHKGVKKGTSKVDDEFLKEINNWRLLLARNIALRNKELSIEELNHAVQLTIDRIIFLRIAEDRGIEKYEQLKKLLELSDNNNGNNVYSGFIELCKKADAKYNSGLFHFTEEKGINLDADYLTPNLKIDDGVFKEIFKNLYYPNCPYEFSVISTEILGNVYEQFLGKKIRLTESHQAKVEEKPEVKKAGGVFYTPQYIVNYIVENTIGELIKDKTPKQVSKMKFVDPACGSGTFLLGAFQYLIDWHIEYYSNMERPPKEVIYEGKDGITRLTINEKKRIILNNIYGVDIDAQAVEVSKLSLLLKVLEDSNKDVLEAQQKLFQERALPYLGDNIKCGNSLIGTDILEQDDLSSDEIKKLNPFDWEDEFAEVFENKGFDAVIGNPPYVGEKGNKKNFQSIKKTKWGLKYYYTKMDLFYYFYHKSLDICKNGGLISFITTSYFLTADGAFKLRKDIKERSAIIQMINCNELQIFENAKGQHNIISILNKNNSRNIKGTIFNILLKEGSNSLIFNNLNNESFNGINRVKIDQNEFYNGEDNIIFLEGVGNDNEEVANINNILKKMECEVPLKDILNINAGADITISKITKRHINNYSKNYIQGEGVFVLEDDELNNKNFPSDEVEIIKPFIKNSDIFKYYIKKPSKHLIYTNHETNIKNYPNVEFHLKKFKPIFIDQMKRYNESYPWFMIHRPREEKIFNLPRIILPYRSKENRFAFSENPLYASRDVFFLTSKDLKFDLFYILSLLNSKLYYIWLYYRGKRKGETLELYATPVGKIPIKKISLDEQKPFIELADKMINLNKELSNCQTPNERRLLEKQIEFTDNKINKLVYELYNLTEEEIEIVENSLN